MFDRLFLAHPRRVGEGYFTHLGVALGFAARLFGAAAACLVHALVPGLFQTTASRAIASLNARMTGQRGAHPVPGGAMDSSTPLL